MNNNLSRHIHLKQYFFFFLKGEGNIGGVFNYKVLKNNSKKMLCFTFVVWMALVLEVEVLNSALSNRDCRRGKRRVPEWFMSLILEQRVNGM